MKRDQLLNWVKLAAPLKVALVLAFALLTFFFGFTSATYHHFPYRYLRDAMWRLRTKPDLSFSSSYFRDNNRLALDGDIDTALLPLHLKGIRISDALPIPKVAGAIAAIRDTTVVMDRLGHFYAALQSGKITTLNFPPLPNNVEAYLKDPEAQIDTKHFRAYSIGHLEKSRWLGRRESDSLTAGGNGWMERAGEPWVRRAFSI
jgi:hypothetical protein